MGVLWIIDAVITLFGIYFLIMTISMKKKNKIPSALLIEQEASKIKDKEGFIKNIFIPMVVCGVAFIAVGIYGLLVDFKIIKIPYGSYIGLIVFMIAFGFYVIKFRNAKSQFCK